MFFEERRSNNYWFLSIIGLAGAYFLGREAGKRTLTKSQNYHSMNSRPEQVNEEFKTYDAPTEF